MYYFYMWALFTVLKDVYVSRMPFMDALNQCRAKKKRDNMIFVWQLFLLTNNEPETREELWRSNIKFQWPCCLRKFSVYYTGPKYWNQNRKFIHNN